MYRIVKVERQGDPTIFQIEKRHRVLYFFSVWAALYWQFSTLDKARDYVRQIEQEKRTIVQVL